MRSEAVALESADPLQSPRSVPLGRKVHLVPATLFHSLCVMQQKDSVCVPSLDTLEKQEACRVTAARMRVSKKFSFSLTLACTQTHSRYFQAFFLAPVIVRWLTVCLYLLLSV